MVKAMAPSPKRFHGTCSCPLEKVWNNLPSELVSEIAKYLGIKDLIRFRRVCKDWLAASYSSSAQIESSRDPWILRSPIKESSNNYILYNQSENEKYVFNIPELEGTICLASDNGWLLLSRGNELFFFCPFSKAKIELPEFPHKDLADHVAAFTCAPTSKKCAVSVINRCNDSQVELHMIQRGEKMWKRYIYVHKRFDLGDVTSATYCEEEERFYYFDGDLTVLTFSAKKSGFLLHKKAGSCIDIRVKNIDYLLLKLKSFCLHVDYYMFAVEWKELEIKQDAGFLVCGTRLRKHGYDCVTRRLNVKGTPGEWDRVILFHPRFHQIPPGLAWSV